MDTLGPGSQDNFQEDLKMCDCFNAVIQASTPLNEVHQQREGSKFPDSGRGGGQGSKEVERVLQIFCKSLEFNLNQ